MKYDMKRVFGLRMMTMLLLSVCVTTVAHGQRSDVHYLHSTELPPGAIGQGQLVRGGPLPGYFQPVEVYGPPGSSISLMINSAFEPVGATRVKAGMLIGQVYQLRVTQIPRNVGLEVYPTIEVINRLYPPPGQAARFPIPIQLTQQELEMALNGQFVTRVIYLENPATAMPLAEDPDEQQYFEIPPTQDPLKVADEMGRPMAILRMGSRVPDESELAGASPFGSPPLLKYRTVGNGQNESVPAPPGQTTSAPRENNTNPTRQRGTERRSDGTGEFPRSRVGLVPGSNQKPFGLLNTLPR
jgi:hypothetical protein